MPRATNTATGTSTSGTQRASRGSRPVATTPTATSTSPIASAAHSAASFGTTKTASILVQKMHGTTTQLASTTPAGAHDQPPPRSCMTHS